jgi:hypothetical protein
MNDSESMICGVNVCTCCQTFSTLFLCSLNVLFIEIKYQKPQTYLIHDFGATCISTSQVLLASSKIINEHHLHNTF